MSPAFSSSSRDPSISDPFPLWSGRASLVDVPTATPLLVNAEVHPEQYSEAEKEASWRAFRAKYQRAEYLESEKLGGFDRRYGPGRGLRNTGIGRAVMSVVRVLALEDKKLLDSDGSVQISKTSGLG